MKKKKEINLFPEVLLGKKLTYKYGDNIGIYLDATTADHVRFLNGKNRKKGTHNSNRQYLNTTKKGQAEHQLEKLQHLKTNIKHVPAAVQEFERKRINQGKINWLRNNPPTQTYSIIRAATITEYEKSGGKFNLVLVEEDYLGNLERRYGFSNPEGYPHGIADELLEEFQNKISDW